MARGGWAAGRPEQAGHLGVAGRCVLGVEAAGEEPLGGVVVERDRGVGGVVRHLSREHVVGGHGVTPPP
jgi:hypothetical protein